MNVKEKKNLLVFGYGLGSISAGVAFAGAVKHGFTWSFVVLLICSVVFGVVTSLRLEALRPSYKGWMSVAHVIGSVVTAVILSAVYFAVFMPIRVVLKLAGKDHLHRKKMPGQASYWIAKQPSGFQKERYQQQF